MLEIHDLQAGYGHKMMLNDLHLSLTQGGVHGLMGLNGAGKTTLLRVLSGLLKPKKGSVNWQGKALDIDDLAFLETENFFYPRITGREYLELFRSQNPAFDITTWEQVFELPLNKLIEDYSTGMKKKLALLAVICLDKPLIILDEPFNGLDLETNHLLKKIIETLAERGKTIIVTSHIPETLTGICQSINFLAEGRILRTYLPPAYSTIETDILEVVNAVKISQIRSLL